MLKPKNRQNTTLTVQKLAVSLFAHRCSILNPEFAGQPKNEQCYFEELVQA